MSLDNSMPQHLITICILTYNRKNSLVNSLRELCSSKIVKENVKILVIDDASVDGTSNLFDKNGEFDRNTTQDEFIYLKNFSNLGYAKNFMKGLAFSNTEYVMMMSDDDRVIIDNIPILIDLLKTSQPDFVSTQSLSFENNRDRGIRQLREIYPIEFMSASALAPGLIYRTKIINPYLQEIIKQIDGVCVFSMMYPQTNLLIRLILDGQKCLHWPHPIFQERDRAVSGIKDSDGNSYSNFKSRVKQFASFELFMEGFVEGASKSEILNAGRNFFIGVLLEADPYLRKIKYLYLFPVGFRALILKLIPTNIKIFLKKKLLS